MDTPIAICYFLQEKDEQNRLWITQEHLYVQINGKLRRFDLERVKHLNIEQRRWWFPVVAGGILAPLSLVAILLNLYNPWWLISLLVGSMLLWYWGATQHEVLAIHQHHHRQDIPLPIVTPNIKEFIQFTNRFLRQGSLPLYVKAEPAAWKIAQYSDYYSPEALQKQGFITAYTEEQWKTRTQQHELWLSVDPLKVISPIRYEVENNFLLPKIHGTIPLTAITEVTNSLTS